MQVIKPTFWQQTLESMLENLSLGEIHVTFPNKEIKIFIGKKKGPVANIEFLTDRTPFYGESGGQKGDSGLANNENIQYLSMTPSSHCQD